jgi:MSHA biogenesis protein MshQ
VTTPPTNLTLRSVDADTVSSIGHIEESTIVHSGRIAIENAFGSELIDLSVPTTVQHYSGINFVNFPADVCSTMSLSLTKVDGSLNVGNGGATGDTCIWDDIGDSGTNNCSAAVILPGPALLQYREPPSVADFNLYLKPPGAGFTGNVDVSGIVDSWLQFDWSGSGLTNPTGRATFGIYRGDDRIIYWRERFD